MPVPVPPHAKLAYDGPRQKAWEWEQELFDGSRKTFSCITREDTVAVIAFLDSETILLQQEEQPGRAAPFLDVPGGVVEKGEAPEITAARELQEETGYSPAVVRLFRRKEFFGMTRFVEDVYIATGLTDGQGPTFDAGEKIVLKPTPWKEAVALSLQGKLRRQEAMLAILAMEFDPEAKKRKDDFLRSA